MLGAGLDQEVGETKWRKSCVSKKLNYVYDSLICLWEKRLADGKQVKVLEAKTSLTCLKNSQELHGVSKELDMTVHAPIYAGA